MIPSDINLKPASGLEERRRELCPLTQMLRKAHCAERMGGPKAFPQQNTGLQGRCPWGLYSTSLQQLSIDPKVCGAALAPQRCVAPGVRCPEDKDSRLSNVSQHQVPHWLSLTLVLGGRGQTVCSLIYMLTPQLHNGTVFDDKTFRSRTALK